MMTSPSQAGQPAPKTKEDTPKTDIAKQRLLRCMDWLQTQNSQEPKKLSLQNKNDIQFIIQTNADRKNFLLAVAEDEATVPPGIEEPSAEPKIVPLKRLRVDELRLECEWLACRWWFTDYQLFQEHVMNHSSDAQVIEDGSEPEYVCLWDVCGHKTKDYAEVVRHMNYHSYHSKLLAVGFNGRATLKLMRCQRESSKRNHLPPLKSDHVCMWTGCDLKFNSIQLFFDHVKIHTHRSEKNLCSWAGCGATFHRKVFLNTHMRSHTCERVIACYHCGAHFSCNRKLVDHLRRQNVYPNSNFSCTVCGGLFATDYLLREHARQHINAYACALCDMSAPTPSTLAQHVRYRHFSDEDKRTHACSLCIYKAVTKSDLRKHMLTHTRKPKPKRKPKRKTNAVKEEWETNTDVSEEEVEKKKESRKYVCHMCQQFKAFSRGSRLTAHLVKVHGAQWPFGHSRFRYQISKDGMYRLTTTRYEFLDVSEKIVDGYSCSKESLTNSFEYTLKLKAEATETMPRRFEISLKNQNDSEDIKKEIPSVEVKSEIENKTVEITMCDVDEHGNIINSEVISSELIMK